MIGAWMIYCVGIGALLGAAALASEHVLRLHGKPVRFSWLAALVASGVLPLIGVLWPRAAKVGPIDAPTGGGVGIGPITLVENVPAVAESWQPSLAALDSVLLPLWAGMSSAFLGYLLLSISALALRKASWRREELEGQRVLVTEDIGPCVIGFLRTRIVMPRWIADAPGRDRWLALLHEREHVKALDPQLLLVAGFLLVAMPWNVPLWWQVRRLRLAVELDCDRRVLAKYPDKRSYGNLLLKVGAQRRMPGGLAFVAFAEPTSSLERRIDAMTARFRGNRRNRTLALLTVAGLALVFACEAAPPDPPAEPSEAQSEVREAGRGGDASTGGSATVSGSEPSGGPSAPAAGPGQAGDRIRFLPAAEEARQELEDARRILTEMQPPPRSEPANYDRLIREADFTGRAADRGQASAPGADISGAPVFSPREIEPELTNRDEVAAALQRSYPGMLRDAGVGGTAILWFFINEQGAVDDVQTDQSSGYPALDAAATEVGRIMRFTPAQNRGQPVPVWVQIPIEFRPVTR